MPLWPCQPWFPVVLGMLQDYPRQLPPQEDLILSSSNQEFITQLGTPTLVAWPISGNPSLHEEFLHRLQNYSSLHGGTKPTLATTLYLQNGQIGVSNGIEIPLLGDVVNFLAELFAEGYQYRSLNAYCSAISSIHQKVDGQSIGHHPLVCHLLKGSYNQKPPTPRYSHFWDVGVVLQFLVKTLHCL